MPYHIVKQGECISKIADRYGFFWDTLWNHEQNAELRQKRINANVLMAGDRVFIPEKRPKEESGQTGKVHTFRLKGIPVKLNLRLKDALGNPRAGIPYTLQVDNKKLSGVTDDDGLISHVVPPQSRQAQLKLNTGEEWSVDLAYMNPVDYASGVQARLKNLGYYRGDLNGQYDEETQEAIRGFQDKNGLPVSGNPDPATKEALVNQHGS